MRSSRVLLFMLGLSVIYGGFIGFYEVVHREVPKPVDFIYTIGFVALTYVWYYLDSAERKFLRTRGLGAAVILASIVAVPYYLYRSREPGQKLKAQRNLLLFLIATAIASMAGAVLVAMVR
jgi:hypothetical protein